MSATRPAFTLKHASFLVCLVSGLFFAGHIYFNLGDYTAERGLVAFGQSCDRFSFCRNGLSYY